MIDYNSFSEEIKVAFIGAAGSGKSSVINILLGKRECEVGQTFQLNGQTQNSQDCRCYISTSSALGINLLVALPRHEKKTLSYIY